MISELDSTDLRILAQLQQDASLSNQDLAERVHVSPATCLRRVRRLREAGYIERTVAQLSPAQLGVPLTTILEVTLEQQTPELQAAFATHVAAMAEVQQCYQVSSGPDFVLILQLRDMAHYHALVPVLFLPALRVRNVRAFFGIRRVKAGVALQLPVP